MTADGSTELLLRSMLDAILDLRQRVTALESRGTITQSSSAISTLMDFIPTLREMFHGLLWLVPRAVMGFGFIEGWWASVWHWALAVIKALL